MIKASSWFDCKVIGSAVVDGGVGESSSDLGWDTSKAASIMFSFFCASCGIALATVDRSSINRTIMWVVTSSSRFSSSVVC